MRIVIFFGLAVTASVSVWFSTCSQTLAVPPLRKQALGIKVVELKNLGLRPAAWYSPANPVAAKIYSDGSYEIDGSEISIKGGRPSFSGILGSTIDEEVESVFVWVAGQPVLLDFSSRQKQKDNLRNTFRRSCGPRGPHVDVTGTLEYRAPKSAAKDGKTDFLHPVAVVVVDSMRVYSSKTSNGRKE